MPNRIDIDTRDLRLVYDNAKEVLKKNDIDARSAVLSQSYLRFETFIQPNTSQYQLSILTNDNYPNTATTYTQKRLALQDSFIVSHIGFRLGSYSTAFPNSYSNFIDFSYPSWQGSAGLFPAVLYPSLAINTERLFELYQGNMQLNVDQKVLLTGWALNKHLFIPDYQQAQAPGAANAFPAKIDEFNGAVDGFYPCEPNIIVSGGKNNQWYINLPYTPAATELPNPATEGYGRMIVILHGVLAQNTTNVK